MRLLMIILLLFLTSCHVVDTTLNFIFMPTTIASDSFFIKSGYGVFSDDIEVKRLNEFHLVNKVNNNSISVDGGGIAAFKVEMSWKDYQMPFESNEDIQNIIPTYKARGAQTFDFGLIRNSEEPFSLILRTTPTDLESQNFLRLEFVSNEFILLENQKIISQGKLPEFNIGKVHRVIIMNDSKKTKVSFDCDEIVNINTEYPITDYLILKNEGLSLVELNALSINRRVPKHIFD